MTTVAEHRTYGNWRRPQPPGLGQLGLAGTVVLFAGGVVTIALLAKIGFFAGLISAAVVAVLLAPLVVHDRHGRNGLQRMTARVAWMSGKSRGHQIYRSGPLTGRGDGRFRLPGLAASIVPGEGTDGYNRPFVVLHHPGTGHVSTVVQCSPDGLALVDQAQVDQWVAHWGGWLSMLGSEQGLMGASVTVETAPDTGLRLQREVENHVSPDAPPVSRQVLDEIVDSYPAGSAGISCRIALTWSRHQAFGGRRGVPEMAAEIGHRLPGLTEPLKAAGAGPARPMSVAELAAAVRVAYDPSTWETVEQVGPASSEIGWEDAGPAAAEEFVDRYWHDGHTSVTWAMSEAPRGVVFSTVLRKLLAPHPAIPRKRVTMVYRPHSVGESADLVERDRRDALFAAQSGHRHLATARQSVSVRSAEQAAQEEATGAGLVRFGLFVTATIAGNDPAVLREVEATVESLAATARLRVRRVMGSQASSFAAALPLGLVLPWHVRVPATIREAM